METQQTFESPEHEIKYLEERILEKKKQLEDKNTREVVSEVVKDHAMQITQAHGPVIPSAAQAQPVDDTKDSVAYLVQVAFSRGISEAVRQVRQTHNPHLIDAFHDALTDHFIVELSNRGLLSHGG